MNAERVDEIMNDICEDENLCLARAALESYEEPQEEQTADITADGKTYIIEWNKKNGTIAITETYDEKEDPDNVGTYETYDFTQLG